MLRRYLALLTLATAQTVLIENAEELSGTDEVRYLRGAVRLRQDTIQLLCDEADLYKDNTFYARGAVRTFIGQGGTISADRLSYDASARRLTYEGRVMAAFGTTTLRTQRLTYDRQTETATYTEGGSLTDTNGTIQSLYATYHIPTSVTTFTQKVRLDHPPYQAFTDTLIYNTDRAVAIFPRPFILYNATKPETLLADRGHWERYEGVITLHDHVQWRTSEIFLRADHALYNQKADTGLATCNVLYQSRTGRGWGIADSAFWHPDTLTLKANAAAFVFTERDTVFVQSHLALLAAPRLYLIGEATFLRLPLSGSADTIVYDSLTRNLFLTGHAWLHSYPYQLFAQAVRVTLVGSTPDSLFAAGAVHTISQVDTFLGFYQQLRSDSLISRWDSTLDAFNPIQYLHKVRAIYYQSDGPHYQGAHDILQAQSLLIALGPNRQPSYLRLQGHPQGRFIPIKMLLRQPLFLTSFQWRPHSEQPHWPIQP